MATSINKGNQILRTQFDQEVDAVFENQAFHNIVPEGIYAGGELTKSNDTSVTVSAMNCLIKNKTGDPSLSLRVRTQESVLVEGVSLSTPYIVGRFIWSENVENYMDILATASIESNDLVIGKATFAGPVMNPDFDYSVRDHQVPFENKIIKRDYDGRAKVNSPVNANDIVNKTWAESQLALKLDLTGGTLTNTLHGTIINATTINATTVNSTNVNATTIVATGDITGNRVFGSVWGDYADFITVEDDCDIEYGRVYIYNDKRHEKSSKYAQIGILGLASDTYGFAVGEVEGKRQIPIAVGGFVLAHCDKIYKSGTPLTCTKDGALTRACFITKMLFPERIVATFYKEEKNDVWNKIKVDKRNWIKVV